MWLEQSDQEQSVDEDGRLEPVHEGPWQGFGLFLATKCQFSYWRNRSLIVHVEGIWYL